MAEVKAPNDKLSFAQKCWLKFFCDKGNENLKETSQSKMQKIKLTKFIKDQKENLTEKKSNVKLFISKNKIRII